MDKKEMKDELMRVLTSIFGSGIRKTIEEYYDADKIDELVKLANHMLTEYMGEENAQKIMKKFINTPSVEGKPW
jgi:hypothetical protein